MANRLTDSRLSTGGMAAAYTKKFITIFHCKQQPICPILAFFLFFFKLNTPTARFGGNETHKGMVRANLAD